MLPISMLPKPKTVVGDRRDGAAFMLWFLRLTRSVGDSTILQRQAHALWAIVSEGCFQTGIESAWTRRTERLRVRKLTASAREVRHLGRIEEPTIRIIAIVEEVIDPAIDLIRLVELIGRVDVEDGVRRQLRILVGCVAHQILVADPQRVATNLECVGDRIIEPGLDAMTWDRRDDVARRYLDVAVRVDERAVRTKR